MARLRRCVAQTYARLLRMDDSQHHNWQISRTLALDRRASAIRFQIKRRLRAARSVMSPTILTEAQLAAAAKADMNDYGGVPPLPPATRARLPAQYSSLALRRALAAPASHEFLRLHCIFRDRR